MSRPIALMLSLAGSVSLGACGAGHDASAPPVSSPPPPTASVAAAPVQGADHAAVPVSAAPPILASGTNPDWSILIEQGISVVKGFDSQRVFPATKSKFSAGSAIFSMGVGARAATLQLDAGPCEQDLAAMKAQAVIAGRTATGCAKHVEDKPDDARDWTSTLFDVVPALRACLARAQVENASANRVSPADAGKLLIDVRNADGSHFNCTVTANGSSVEEFVAAPADSAGPPDITPAFSRGAAAFARLGCDEAPLEVVSGSGELLGYVQRGHCGEAAPAVPP